MSTYSHCQTREEKGVARKLTKFVKKREPLISFKSFHSPEANQTLDIS
jgi:ferritin